MLKIIVGLVIVIALLALGPWLVIYAVNDIGQYLWPDRVVPFNLSTWFSVVILGAFLRANVSVKRTD